jgi:AbrB family looped-hinge helix DNA binding protein
MEKFATTRLSSKGQVVIPEIIRNKLNLSAGTEFIVIGEGDVLILKSITPPDFESFEKLINRARSEAKDVGLSRADINKAISKARRKS